MQKIRKNIKSIIILQTIIFLLLRFSIGINHQSFSYFNHNRLINQITHQVDNKSVLAVGAVAGETIAGFTLAEVLITLLVIGIVSSLVIPGLIQDTQEMEYKQAFKKVYSDIAQAAVQYKQDNGGTIPVNATTSWNTNIFPTLTSYLKIQRDCGASSCFRQSTNPVFNYKSLNNNDESVYYFDDGQRILVNGVFLASEYSRNLLWVDVNGFAKGPNILGKDLFGIVVTQKGITPAGSSASGINSNTCSQSDSGKYSAGAGTYFYTSGWGCAALVMQGIDY